MAVTELLTIVAPLIELCLHNILRQEFGCIPALCTELVNCCRVAHARRSLYCMLRVELKSSVQAPVLLSARLHPHVEGSALMTVTLHLPCSRASHDRAIRSRKDIPLSMTSARCR